MCFVSLVYAACREGMERWIWRRSGTGRGHGDPDDQAAAGTVVEGDLTTVAMDDGPGDSKAEAGATGRPRARRLQAEEWLEHLLARRGRDARATIFDGQPDRIALSLEPDLGFAPVFHGVVDQVSERTPKRHRATGEAQSIRPQVLHRLAHISQVIAERAHQGSEIHVLARLAGADVASEGQGLVEHGRHGVQIDDRL